MKIYVANISQSEKMVYLSGLRNIKENGKYTAVPVNVSVKKEVFKEAIKSIKFPFIIDVRFVKGKGAIISPYNG